MPTRPMTRARRGIACLMEQMSFSSGGPAVGEHSEAPAARIRGTANSSAGGTPGRRAGVQRALAARQDSGVVSFSQRPAHRRNCRLWLCARCHCATASEAQRRTVADVEPECRARAAKPERKYSDASPWTWRRGARGGRERRGGRRRGGRLHAGVVDAGEMRLKMLVRPLSCIYASGQMRCRYTSIPCQSHIVIGISSPSNTRSAAGVLVPTSRRIARDLKHSSRAANHVQSPVLPCIACEVHGSGP
jgi:hypothetical protein